jgi:ribosome-binding protein aMBF1 (putative translation factor)
MDPEEDLWNQVTYLTSKRAREEKKQKALRESQFETKKKVEYSNTNFKKMDEDTGDYSTKKADISLCKIIQVARTNQKLKQKDLAKKINVDINTYNKYESGALIPDNKIKLKLEHYLKVKLTGKKSEWGKLK